MRSASPPPTRICCNTTRSTDFIAPKSAISRAFRDGVLALAETEPLARRLVNSGRLSVATCYDGSPLNGPDGFTAGECPAAAPARRPSMRRWPTPGCLRPWAMALSVVWLLPRGPAAAAPCGAPSGVLAQGTMPVKTLLVSDADRLLPLWRRAASRPIIFSARTSTWLPAGALLTRPHCQGATGAGDRAVT